jgi:uncharacterized repeat protein (TIGR03943 family)
MISRFLQAGIMAAWAAFFLWLFVFNQPALARLLHPRLWWLVLGGAIVLMLFCCVALSRLTSPEPAGPLRWTWPSYLVLLVPLIYFWLMQSARFDSQTFIDRSTSPIDTAIAVQDEEENQAASDSTDATAPIEASFGQIVQDPQQYAGRKVEVLCQALTDTRLPEDQFICYRFRITCCAADGQPVFVFVNRQTLPAPAKDAWVRVRGKLSTRTVDNISLPFVSAEEILTEAEPAFPFVF